MISFYRGKRAAARGEHERALAEFLRVARHKPDFGEAWKQAATMLECLGRPAAAAAAYEEALAANPDDRSSPVVLWRLGQLQESSSNIDSAIRCYERLAQEYPFTKVESTWQTYAQLAHGKLAELYVQRKDFENAYRHKLYITESNLSFFQHELEPFKILITRAAGAVPAALPAMRLKDGQFQHVSNYEERPSFGGSDAQSAHCVAAPDSLSKVFDTLEVELELPANAKSRPLVIGLKPLGGLSIPYVSYTLEYDNAPAGSKLRARVKLPEALGAGFEFEFPPGCNPSNNYSWGLSATTKPVQPGILSVTTEPAGILFKIDGVVRGIGPCRVRNLAPGKHKFELAVSGPGIPNISNEFVVAADGETRLDYVSTGSASSNQGFPNQKMQIQFYKSMLAVRSPAHMIDGLRLAWRDGTGWLLVFASDNTLRITTSLDGKSWSAPMLINSVPHSADLIELKALLVAPNSGRTCLIYRSSSGFSAVATSDLEHWSQPTQILMDHYDYIDRYKAATVTTLGRFVALIDSRETDFQETTRNFQSTDGVNWTSAAVDTSNFPRVEFNLSALPNGGIELFAMPGKQGDPNYQHLTSDDGISWAEAYPIPATRKKLPARTPYGQHLEIFDSTIFRYDAEKKNWDMIGVLDFATPVKTVPEFYTTTRMSIAFAPPDKNKPGNVERMLLANDSHGGIWVRGDFALDDNSTGQVNVTYEHPQKALAAEPEQKAPSTPANASAPAPPAPSATEAPSYRWIGLAGGGLILAGAAVFILRRRHVQ